MANLNTFGAVMAFAIQLEANLQAYYAAANPDRAREADKRRSKLERIRRENVVEITLEPIDGLDEADFGLNLEDVSAAGQQATERAAAEFYAAAAPKMNVLAVQRALERLAQEHRALAGDA